MYYWIIGSICLLCLALAARWAYVAHRALKTLDKYDEHRKLVGILLKDLDAAIADCLPRIPLANGLEMYTLHERVKSARNLFN